MERPADPPHDATRSERLRSLQVVPIPIVLTIVVLLSIPVFLASGYGIGLKRWQPAPIYAYLTLLLVMLQAIISVEQTMRHRTYLFSTSLLAILYAGVIEFSEGKTILDDVHFYVFLNILLVIVYLAYAVRRLIGVRPLIAEEIAKLPNSNSSIPSEVTATRSRVRQIVISSVLGSEGAGLVILLLCIRLGLYILMHSKDVTGQTLYTDTSPLVYSLGPYNMGRWDFILGVVAFIILMLNLLIIGIQSVLPGPGYNDVRRYMGTIGELAVSAGNQVRTSVRLVLSPLIWLLPAFSMAYFAYNLTNYYNTSAHAGSLWGFTDSSSYIQSLQGLLLGIGAVGAVLVATLIFELNGNVIQRMMNTLQLGLRGMALITAPFLFGMVAINELVILTSSLKVTPFRVSGGGVLALILLAVYLGVSLVLERRLRKTAVEAVESGR